MVMYYHGCNITYVSVYVYELMLNHSFIHPYNLSILDFSCWSCCRGALIGVAPSPSQGGTRRYDATPSGDAESAPAAVPNAPWPMADGPPAEAVGRGKKAKESPKDQDPSRLWHRHGVDPFSWKFPVCWIIFLQSWEDANGFGFLILWEFVRDV